MILKKGCFKLGGDMGALRFQQGCSTSLLYKVRVRGSQITISNPHLRPLHQIHPALPSSYSCA